jgi:hypothetical protein
MKRLQRIKNVMTRMRRLQVNTPLTLIFQFRAPQEGTVGFEPTRRWGSRPSPGSICTIDERENGSSKCVPSMQMLHLVNLFTQPPREPWTWAKAATILGVVSMIAATSREIFSSHRKDNDVDRRLKKLEDEAGEREKHATKEEEK